MANPLVRALPHVVDSVLLASAMTLSVLSHQYPLTQDWLTVKVLVLFLYIVSGAMALRYGPSGRSRLYFLGLAFLAYGFIISVAMTRHPLGVFAGMTGLGVNCSHELYRPLSCV
jgi:uncharacterized membrane protein SirB2